MTSQLGEGGFAIIYAAKDVATGKEFALKRFLGKNINNYDLTRIREVLIWDYEIK